MARKVKFYIQSKTSSGTWIAIHKQTTGENAVVEGEIISPAIEDPKERKFTMQVKDLALAICPKGKGSSPSCDVSLVAPFGRINRIDEYMRRRCG